MSYDYGFELPDTRHTFLSDGEQVSVKIIRHWYQEEEETSFKVSFCITRAGQTTSLPIGCSESKACAIAHQLYEQTAEDIEEIEAIYEQDAIGAAEQAIGA